jgi:hypothetical protein
VWTDFHDQCWALVTSFSFYDEGGHFERLSDRCLDVDPVSMALALYNADCNVCGDGEVNGAEGCDAGGANSNAPDAACRTNCQPKRCGDEVVDSGEDCDDGPRNAEGEACRLDCKTPETAQSVCTLEFESSDQYARFVDPDNVLALDVFTLSITFRRDGRGRDASTGVGGFLAEPLLTKGRGEADGSNVDMNWGLFVCDPDGTPRLCADFEASSSGQNYPVKATSGDIVLGEWHTGVATWDGSTWKLYLDGTIVGQVSPPTGEVPRDDSIQWAGIGTAMNSRAEAVGYWHGAVSDATVWNIALSASEIASATSAEPIITFDMCGSTTSGLHAIDVELMNGLVATMTAGR